jgi:signal transduction histidine kinase
LAELGFFRRNIFPILIIIGTGTFLSVLSYQYSSFTADEIAKIASQDVRSNSRIEAHDLSQILVHRIGSITNNLQALTMARPIQQNELETAQYLLNAAQYSTKDLTDGYYWLDKNGKVVTWSNINQETLRKVKGFDLSEQDFFRVPNSTFTPYYSSVIESPDNVPRVYISYPIIGNQDKPGDVANGSINRGSFLGVIVVPISVNTIGKFLQNELPPEFVSNVGLIDRNGIIIYARNQSLIGKNYLAEEFQSTIPTEIKNSYNNILRRSLQSLSGSEDVTFTGGTTTISYQPVTIDVRHLWTLFIGTPHNLASDVGLLIDQQKNFSTLLVIIIAAIGGSIALLILSWNKRLEAAVDVRTSELKGANVSLVQSNKLLAAANEQLKMHDRMQKEFINVAAHELRTPIMPILGDAEFIENQFNGVKNTVEVEKEEVASIIRNAKRLDQLASDILDVTKIESNSLRLNKEEFNLNEIITLVVKEIRNLIANNDAGPEKVTIHYNPKDIFVVADKGRLTQVLFNLLGNAVKFTEKGNIFVDVEEKADQLVVNIRDTGRGIHSEILPRLFTKFATKSERGTGLGLFISKSIVEAHGGKIWAQNNVNESGATFKFSLPFVD